MVRYYQAALDTYHGDGCRSCRWSELSVTEMGNRALLAAVTWDLLREDGTAVTHWRQFYGLSLSSKDGKRPTQPSVTRDTERPLFTIYGRPAPAFSTAPIV